MMRKLFSSGVSSVARAGRASGASVSRLSSRRGFYAAVTYPETPRPASEVPCAGSNLFSQIMELRRFRDERGEWRNGTDNTCQDQVMKYLYKNYAAETNITAIKVPGFSDFYMVCDPNEFMKVMRSEGKYPHGGFTLTWPWKSYYARNEDKRSFGKFLTATEQWKQYRMTLQKDLISPKAARGYVGAMAKAARIASDAAKDYEHEMNWFTARASFDIFTSVLFGRMSEAVLGENSSNPDGIRLCKMACDAFSQLVPMVNSPFEYFADKVGFKTKRARILETAFEGMADIGIPLMKEFRELENRGELSEYEKNSYFYRLMKRSDDGEISTDEINEMAAFLLNVSVDTTSSIINWLLIHLAMNPDVQEKVHEELRSELGGDDLTHEHVMSGRGEWLPYLHCVLRETHRVTPALVGQIVRKIPTDLTICGFNLPKDSWVTCESHASQNNPELIPDHAEFRPERWLPEAVEARKGTPAEVLDHSLFRAPFSAGARMCPGSRVAILEVLTLVSRMVQDYEIRLDEPNIKTHYDVPRFTGATVQPSPMPKFKLTRRAA